MNHEERQWYFAACRDTVGVTEEMERVHDEVKVAMGGPSGTVSADVRALIVALEKTGNLRGNNPLVAESVQVEEEKPKKTGFSKGDRVDLPDGEMGEYICDWRGRVRVKVDGSEGSFQVYDVDEVSRG